MHSFDMTDFAILVVEDEPLLLMDAIDLITEAGYGAYGAANANEAIRLLEKHSDICVLFTDVHMPGSIDGLTLAHLVRDRWPSVAIIITSGHVTVTDASLPDRAVFFAKPYTPERLTDTLASIARQTMGAS